MKITVFGANGRVGSLIVKRALMQGHEIVAFVHSTSTFAGHENLQVLKGDVYDKHAVAKAIDGTQAVISALGSWGTPKKDILTEGMRNIIPAMQTSGISRIISLTGAGANAPGDKLTVAERVTHRLMELAALKVLKDAEMHIRLLSESDLNWTVVRSPIMNNRGNSACYKLVTARPPAWAMINRQSVASEMLDLATTDSFAQSSPFIIRQS